MTDLSEFHPTIQSCKNSKELRKQTIKNITPLIDALCTQLTKENIERIEEGKKPIPIFKYIIDIFKEATIRLYVTNYKKNKVKISKALTINRLTLRKRLEDFNIPCKK